ncbi:MAG: lpxK [Ramlibacter sp.]|nr:lpxK [Ramlibacter sp.]MDB5913444.1 lpxK [Ramlibacter sp.]
MPAALQRAWLGRGPLACLLLPLSLVYAAVTGLHRALYALGLKKAERLPVPVIVVGNVIAGGAGKTPVVLALIQHLQERGLRPGIVSRGYGRDGSSCEEVQDDDSATSIGDEPLLLRRKTGVPVFVAPGRAVAGRALLHAYPATPVIVSDDGLQHRGLARDIEICVFDARGTGNGWLLPAGPLRESWPRQVDLVLRPPSTPHIRGHAIERSLAPYAVRADGTRMALAQFTQPVQAVAGIAKPASFFDMLRATGLVLEATHALPDHHDFADTSGLPAQATLLCTEKDAVKLWRTRPDAWAVPLQVAIAPAFWQELDRLLEPRLSSPHGSPPP